VNDEPSLGELGRLIQALRGDVRDDMAQINARLDRLVSMDVYTAEKAAMSKDIADLTKDVEQLAAKQERDVTALQDQRHKDNDRVTQTRRWLVASVVIPLLGLVLPVILFLAGGKS
jgi:ABC-type phosphate transport system auxiliary subunit